MGLAGRSLTVVSTARRRARFRAWATALDHRMRRMGTRLILDAPHGVEFLSPPSIYPIPHGLGGPSSPEPSLTLRFGRGVDLGEGLAIEYRRDGTNLLDVADDTYFQHGSRCVIGGGSVVLGKGCRIRSFNILKSSGELVLGDDVLLSYGCVLHCENRIELGDSVGVGERVSIIDSSHLVDGGDTIWYLQPTRSEPVTIERNVLISANCTVLRGVHIEPNAFVAGGSTLRKGRYPAGWMVGGDPARAMKPLGPDAAPGGA